MVTAGTHLDCAYFSSKTDVGVWLVDENKTTVGGKPIASIVSNVEISCPTVVPLAKDCYHDWSVAPYRSVLRKQAPKDAGTRRGRSDRGAVRGVFYQPPAERSTVYVACVCSEERQGTARHNKARGLDDGRVNNNRI